MKQGHMPLAMEMGIGLSTVAVLYTVYGVWRWARGEINTYEFFCFSLLLWQVDVTASLLPL